MMSIIADKPIGRTHPNESFAILVDVEHLIGRQAVEQWKWAHKDFLSCAQGGEATELCYNK